jgi:hypothetical protein
VLIVIVILIVVYERSDHDRIYDQISRSSFLSLHGSKAGSSGPVAQ